jgi:hypothetical protein
MKLRFLIPFLILILVFGLTFTDCFFSSNSPANEEESKLKSEETIKNFIEYLYN